MNCGFAYAAPQSGPFGINHELEIISARFAMKRAAQVLLLLVSFGAIVVHAQTNNPQGLIKHVIVVIQENRTPDNLFGAQNSSGQFFESCVNLQNYGYYKNSQGQ